MLLNGFQRCLALTELAEILLDKLQRRKCPVFKKKKIRICLAMQSWIKTGEMLVTRKEIAMVVPDPSAEAPSLSFAVQVHTVMMRRSTAPLPCAASRDEGRLQFFSLCQRKIFFQVKRVSWLASTFYTVLPWKMIKIPLFPACFIVLLRGSRWHVLTMKCSGVWIAC